VPAVIPRSLAPAALLATGFASRKYGLLLLLTPGLLLGAMAPLRAGEEIQGRVIKPEGGVKSIAASPDGRWLVTGTKEDTRLWNLKAVDTLAKCFVLRGSVGPISPDGQWLLTVVNGRDIWLWNLKAEEPSAAGKEVARGEESWNPGVAISPNNRWLVTRSRGTLRLWDLKAKDEGAKPRALMEQQRYFPTVSGNGRWLAAGGGHGVLAVWDLAADDPAPPQQITKDKQFAPPFLPRYISSDGRWLITEEGAGGRSGMLRRLWDLRPRTPGLVRSANSATPTRSAQRTSRPIAAGWQRAATMRNRGSMIWQRLIPSSGQSCSPHINTKRGIWLSAGTAVGW